MQRVGCSTPFIALSPSFSLCDLPPGARHDGARTRQYALHLLPRPLLPLPLLPPNSALPNPPSTLTLPPCISVPLVCALTPAHEHHTAAAAAAVAAAAAAAAGAAAAEAESAAWAAAAA